MPEQGQVVSVNISTRTGTIKEPVGRARIDERGLEGDAHAGDWHRQVSLLASESVERFAGQIGRRLAWGEFAENITTRGLELTRWHLLDELEVGGARLQVTQIGKKCHGDDCAIFREVGRCVMPREGIFCRVLRPGEVGEGDAIRYLPRQWKFLVITASDRCARGQASDRSGPAAERWLRDFCAGQQLACRVERALVPDEAEQLRGHLERARAAGLDAVFITGGTGIGPRDVTPEVVQRFCGKLLPGIVEAVRVQAGASNPNAWLSRSLAGVRDTMLVFAMPGSTRAVGEYLEAIGKVLLHAVWMVHGLDPHR
ncbi:MAG: molybdenum cofactor synthesis protein [Deltaproteobacteria bacterium]|nr:MAG: molybdenum cofactor synthesis protein [Deltaproteobacteria bacterium]